MPLRKKRRGVKRGDGDGEHSSVGSEHLLYTQRVIGSSPIVPTVVEDDVILWGGTFFEGSIAQLV